MIKAIKQVHSKSVVLVKIGSFYHAYGKDSYILSYMFGYKLKKFEKDYTTCGFPLDSISKVIAKLEEKKINYVILDRRNNYEEDEKSDNGNLNTYDNVSPSWLVSSVLLTYIKLNVTRDIAKTYKVVTTQRLRRNLFIVIYSPS